MKKILFAFTCLLAARQASAQITLSAAQYPTAVAGTTDTTQSVVLSTLPTITTGGGQVWDFTAAIYDGTNYQLHTTPPAPAFTSAQYTDSTRDSVGFYQFNTNIMYGIPAAGLQSYGTHINSQTISMESITSNPADSFTLFTQDIVYTALVRNIAFPATYPAYWRDSAKTTMHGTLRIPVMGFIDAPLTLVTNYYMYDTVAGWGVARVRNSTGNISAINVLLVRSNLARVDSTFINGVFITELQKDYSGLPNGWQTGATYYKLYAEDAVTPIATITYSSLTGTSVQHAEILSRNFPREGVNKIANAADIHIYPNPVTDRSLFITIAKERGSYSYELVNITGQAVMTGKLPQGQVNNYLQLSKDIAPGSYFLRINNNGTQVSVQKLEVE